METPQLLQGRSLECKDGSRAADMNDTESQTSGTQDPSSGSAARSTTSSSNGVDSLDDEGKADDIEHVAAAAGEMGAIVKLGWTDSSGSSNDEVCSYLGDEGDGDKERGSRNDGVTHGADFRDDEIKVEGIVEHVRGGAGGGKQGAIVKLGWTDSSGSSNDGVCSYLGDESDGDQEGSRSRNDGVTHGADSRYDERKVGDIIRHVASDGGEGGQKGAIVKLGWTDSSGSSNDEVCSYLCSHTDGDKEGGSLNNGVTHGADSRDEERKVDEIIGHVAGGGGEMGAIVKLGWTDSSGSSSDEVCSCLGDEGDGDKETGSRNDGVNHGADSRYDEGKVDVIIGHVPTGGGEGGQKGAIVKLGWTDSSGSSNDEVCSYLGDEGDGGKERASLNDGVTHGADSRDDERKVNEIIAHVAGGGGGVGESCAIVKIGWTDSSGRQYQHNVWPLVVDSTRSPH